MLNLNFPRKGIVGDSILIKPNKFAKKIRIPVKIVNITLYLDFNLILSSIKPIKPDNTTVKMNIKISLKKFGKNDLIVKHDLLPFVKTINNKKYSALAQRIKNASNKGQIEELAEIRNELVENLDFANRADLINWCNRELYKQTVSDYVFKYINKSNVWAEIASEFPDLDENVKEALSKRQTRQLRTEDLLIEIQR